MEGTPFGRYRLLQLIGRGGMGEVWRAYDTETERVVALKLLPTQFAHDQEFIERFRREARVAAGLNSPNVVPIHHFGEIDGKLYVDMQVIAGRDLQAVLDQGPMPAERAVRVVEQVAAALRAAHAAGLVHRDVKPSNVLLNADDFAYLIDFGLARTDDDAGLTVTGHTVGTFAYMAPERYEGLPVDARTDVYSLACVLYQCLTGRRPFEGSGAQQMIGHLRAPVPRPTDVMPHLPRAFDEVIARGMAKDVNARYQTIDELARAARAAVSYDQSYPPSGPVTQAWHTPPPMPAPTQQAFVPMGYGPPMARPARTPWWRRRPVVISTALLAVIAVAVTAVVLVTSSSPPADPGPATTTVAGATYLPQITLNSEGLVDVRSITVNQSGSVIGLCCSNAIFSMKVPGQPPKIVPLDMWVGTAPSIAVDDQGNGYLALTDDTVVRLDGALNQTKLPFPPMDVPRAIGVDAAGDVFVLNLVTKPTTVFEVWKLEFGAPSAVVLPFDNPNASFMAVAPDGTVYVDNINSGTILKLAPGANRPTGLALPRQGGSDAAVTARGLAATGDGSVYLAADGADGNLVYRYAPDQKTAEALPISGLRWENSTRAVGLAVDGDGNVNVVDQVDKETTQIVKLPRVKE